MQQSDSLWALSSLCHKYLSALLHPHPAPPMAWFLAHLPHDMDDAVYLALLLLTKYTPVTGNLVSNARGARPRTRFGVASGQGVAGGIETFANPDLFLCLVFVSFSALRVTAESMPGEMNGGISFEDIGGTSMYKLIGEMRMFKNAVARELAVG